MARGLYNCRDLRRIAGYSNLKGIRVLEFWRWPAASPQMFLGLTAVFVALFGAAVVIDMIRKRMAQQRLLIEAWEQARAIAEEKDVSETEWALLEEAIAQFAPDAPLEVVTVRRRFNECVAAYMATLQDDAVKFAETGEILRELRTRLALDFIPVGQRIDTTRELNRGQTILATRAEEKGARWFALPLRNVDEAYLYASLERKGPEAPPKLSPGDELRCRMWREDDARYSFNLTVAEVKREDETVILYHADGIRRIQSRQHFRVRHNQLASIGIIHSRRDDDYEDVAERPVSSRIRGRVTSLSAGGLAVETSQPLSSQSVMRIALTLHEGEPVTANARVVGVSPLSAGRHLIRGAFVGMDDEDRDRIEKYVWWRQQPKPNPDDASH